MAGPVTLLDLVPPIDTLSLHAHLAMFSPSFLEIVLKRRPTRIDRASGEDCVDCPSVIWPPGEMASRLTTNQEIAGSTPAVVIECF